MPTKDFFAERTESSEVKTEIVRKYFWPWAKIISNQVKKMGGEKIGYADLFAGKGRYQDGSESTPIEILRGAIRDPQIREMLVAVFNDEDRENIIALEHEVKTIAGIALLKYPPVFLNSTVDDSLAQKLGEISTIPTLFFLDPWGYKGLSLRLIEAVLKPWGCDCIFFFNYNRINAALPNPKFTQNMNSFFGKERAERLRAATKGKSPDERENLIITELKRALKQLGGAYTTEYFFKDNSGRKTSHFLIFASKHPLGEGIMKEIMAGESSSEDHGVASFGFNPLDKETSTTRAAAPTLFDLTDPIRDLATDLLSNFAGRAIKVKEVFHDHHIGKHYTAKNYKQAIMRLESEGKVQLRPTMDERKRAGKITLGDNVIVIFPSKENS